MFTLIGILNVNAKDKGTSQSQQITITADKGRLDSDEIERLVKEVSKHPNCYKRP
jgi:molecular chaperone DnaK (HSP70)